MWSLKRNTKSRDCGVMGFKRCEEKRNFMYAIDLWCDGDAINNANGGSCFFLSTSSMPRFLLTMAMDHFKCKIIPTYFLRNR